MSSSLFQERNLKYNLFPPQLWDDNKNKNFSIKNDKNFFFNMNDILLKEEEPNKENNIIEKNNDKKKKTNFFNNQDIKQNNISIFKNINKENICNDLNIKEDNNNSIIKKFFTVNNNGLKCSCFKTKCDKYYCECFRSGRYCFNCNCKKCSNQPPKYSTTDIKNNNNNEIINKDKKIFCTCTKSGCKLKYCECFKSGLECTDLCRCIKCENPKINKNNNKLYKISFVNSIYIINNQFYQEINSKNGNKKFINKKRKKSKNKLNKNKENINDKEIIKNKDNNNFNERLFDENGKIIFTHISLNNLDFDNL